MIAVTTACSAACSGTAARPAPPPVAGPASPGPFRKLSPPGGVNVDYPVVAARIFALGDSQFHHLYGKRTFAQSPFADRIAVEVAIRPAALDDGSDLLLATFLAERGARYADWSLVYMGDAADLSCTQEMDRFLAVMRGAGVDRFLMVTSNHDGFYAGNYTQKQDLDGKLEFFTDMPADWTRACAEPGSTEDHRLTRGGAVRRIAGLLPEAPVWATHFVQGDETDPSGYRDSALAYVRPLGGGDAGAPPAWGLFLDTVDYRDFDLPKSKGAGTVGSVSKTQLQALDRALFEADVAAGDPPPIWVAFGHHPIDEMDKATRERLLRFFDARPEILAYVSAHTHYSDERAHELPSGRTLPEIVVGSTTDFSGPGVPQAARLLELRWDPAAPAAGVASWRLELDVDALCGGVSPVAAGDPLGYTAYRIARDDVPDIPTDLWDLVWSYLEDSDLTGYRVAQNAGALMVENKLVRALASLYRRAPGALDDGHKGSLDRLVAERLVPEKDRPPLSTDYDKWYDPVLAGRLPALARMFHSFGAHRDLFQTLHESRWQDAERRRYFACHAARAAEAESRLPPRRDGKVWRIR